jgi:hypothetical protein
MSHVTAVSSARVTAKDLNRLIDGKLRERTVAFDTILNSCLNKVKRYAQRKQYRCVFEVPDIIIGEPLYKLPHAISHVAKILKEDCGFYIRLFAPKLLYISWDMDEIAGKKVMKPMNIGQRNNQLVPYEGDYKPEFHPSIINQNRSFYNPVVLTVPSPLPLPIASRPVTKKKKHDEGGNPGDSATPHSPLSGESKHNKMQTGNNKFNELARSKPSGKFILNLA